MPDGSQWKEIAKKRWKAKDAREEAHIVYYVFFLLIEEAKPAKGRELAKEKWEQIRPELVKRMGQKPDQDSIMVLGVPTIFK